MDLSAWVWSVGRICDDISIEDPCYLGFDYVYREMCPLAEGSQLLCLNVEVREAVSEDGEVICIS